MWPVKLEWSTFSTSRKPRPTSTFLQQPRQCSSSTNKQEYSSTYSSPSPPIANMADRTVSRPRLEWWTIISGHPHPPRAIQTLESAPPPQQSQHSRHLTPTQQSL